MKIKWSEEFELGLAEIDTQHKRLIYIINQLDAAWEEKKHGESVKAIFQSLRDYAGYHFGYEEQEMERHGFHGAAKHKSGHTNFTITMNHYYLQLIQGNSTAMKAALDFLSNWLCEHILIEDKKYVTLLKPFLANAVEYKVILK